MPVEYRIDFEHSLIRLKLCDPFGPDELVATVERLLSDPQVARGQSLLSDHSQLDFTATTNIVRAIPAFAARLAERLGPFRCALVVPRDASYGMGRMTEVLTDAGPGQIRAFRSLEEAEAWLGSPAA